MACQHTKYRTGPAHIAALGVPAEPLPTHLRMMHSSSSWDYGRRLG